MAGHTLLRGVVDEFQGAGLFPHRKEWPTLVRSITVLGELGFENALAMRRERAVALGIRTIADLARHARELT